MSGAIEQCACTSERSSLSIHKKHRS